MMLEQEDNQPDIESHNEQSPGSILRAAREKKKITLIDAANELRLSLARLTDLEENRFSEMGAITFAKGYLRSYARFLNVSEEKVLQSFDEMNLGSDISSHKPSLINEKMNGVSSKAPRRMGYLVLLVIAILAAFWWHNRDTISESFLEITTPVSENDAGNVSVIEDESPHSIIIEEDQNQEASPDDVNTYSLPVQGISLLNANPELSPESPLSNNDDASFAE